MKLVAGYGLRVTQRLVSCYEFRVTSYNMRVDYIHLPNTIRFTNPLRMPVHLCLDS